MNRHAYLTLAIALSVSTACGLPVDPLTLASLPEGSSLDSGALPEVAMAGADAAAPDLTGTEGHACRKGSKCDEGLFCHWYFDAAGHESICEPDPDYSECTFDDDCPRGERCAFEFAGGSGRGVCEDDPNATTKNWAPEGSCPINLVCGDDGYCEKDSSWAVEGIHYTNYCSGGRCPDISRSGAWYIQECIPGYDSDSDGEPDVIGCALVCGER